MPKNTNIRNTNRRGKLLNANNTNICKRSTLQKNIRTRTQHRQKKKHTTTRNIKQTLQTQNKQQNEVKNMCEYCQEIIKYIEQVFGHKVDMKKLIQLIETSPLKEE